MEQASKTSPDMGLNLNELDISDKEFARFSELIYSLTGINITDKKRQLVISRLGKRLRANKLKDFGEYYRLLEDRNKNKAEISELINQITTNKTDFFRENHHFDFVRNRLIPELVRRGEKNFRFWSAGCSSGEEPYSLAMTILDKMEEMKLGFGYDVRILATDLDTNMLRKATNAVYDKTRLEPVPDHIKRKYFHKLDELNFEVSPRVRDLVKLGRINLMDDYPFKKGFNLILCRNVLIYFTQEDRRKVVRKFWDHLRPNGYLLLGHSESLLADSVGYRSLGHTVYQRT